MGIIITTAISTVIVCFIGYHVFNYLHSSHEIRRRTMGAKEVLSSECYELPEEDWETAISLFTKIAQTMELSTAFAFADYFLDRENKSEHIKYGIALGFSNKNSNKIDMQHSLYFLDEDITNIAMKNMIDDASERQHRIQKIQTCFRRYLLNNGISLAKFPVMKPCITYGAQPYFLTN